MSFTSLFEAFSCFDFCQRNLVKENVNLWQITLFFCTTKCTLNAHYFLKFLWEENSFLISSTTFKLLNFEKWPQVVLRNLKFGKKKPLYLYPDNTRLACIILSHDMDGIWNFLGQTEHSAIKNAKFDWKMMTKITWKFLFEVTSSLVNIWVNIRIIVIAMSTI